MADHTVKAYDSELGQLNKKIAHMGGLAEALLGQAFDALVRRDPQLAEQTIQSDRTIDQLHLQIEELAIQMIARRQPLADDLRQIMAALKISTDLERVGDLAKNIAKRTLAIANEQYPRPLVSGLEHMVERALRQLKDVLDAYANRDVELAISVWRDDAQLDAMYTSVFRELLTYMMEDPRNISFCTHLLFGAKNIERIGDHTTNIAETVHYLATGRTLTDERPRVDDTNPSSLS